MEPRPKTGSAKMRPRARLISLIGEELISDEPVALVELVKNAYDADASLARVSFKGANPNRPDHIVVTDDGIGMDLNTVLTSWFEPGTLAKRKQTVSLGGRLYQGAKGIGRFAAARLATSLFMETKKEDEEEGVVVVLEWGQFTEESYLDEINLEYEIRPLDFKNGTRLTLGGLRKTWNESEYEALYARLSRLISPFKADVLDFDIVLEIPGYPQFSGEVQPPDVILKPRYQLKGNVNKNGEFTGDVLYEGRVHKKLKDRKLGRTGAVPSCGPFEVEIRAWDRDRESLEPLVRQFGQGIRQIRQQINTYCGVSIYRDGFRVYPYGQKGDDWLGLDLRSRQNPVNNLANNQVVGSIRISRTDNPNLQDRSTREGMILNPAHAALEEWFIESLSLLEAARYDLRPHQEQSEAGEPLFEAFDLNEAVKRARKELGQDHPVALMIAETEKQVSAGVERLQDTFSRLLMSAGLGHMVDIVIHEIGAPLGKINRQLVVLEKELEATVNARLWGKIQAQTGAIKGWLEQIFNLRQRLEPQTPAKRGRAVAFDVKDEIEDNFRLYEALISKQQINWKVVAPRDAIRVKMARASLDQILVNLIDNSIFWITRHKGEGKGGRILVRLEPLERGFRFLFCDDGPGVAEEDMAKVFEPYFTRKPNGMGLGLYIARMIIDSYGKLLYHDDGELCGACFEARFETSVGR